MNYQRKRVAKRLASGLLAGALAIGGLAISGGTASAKTPSSPSTARISGADRYETAVAVARDYYSAAPTDAGKNGIVIASGENPNDALAASALAGFIDAPILLVQKDTLPTSVADYLADNVTGFRAAIGKKVYFVGGTSAISEAVKTSIMTIVTTGDPITPIGSERVSGADRYATAVAVSKVAGLTDAADVMIIANGADGRWPDALSVGLLAAGKKWPVILTGDGGLNAAASARIAEYLAIPGSVKKFLLVGGTSVLPSTVESTLVGLNVPVSNIYRRGGSDRYETNTKLAEGLTALGSTADLGFGLAKLGLYGGANVALASGASPWDALAAAPWAYKKDYHLILTSSPAPGPFTAGLVGALSALLDGPANVSIIGGRTAVSNTVRDVVIATAKGAADTTSTISGCVAGRTSATFTVAGGTWNIAETDKVTAAANVYFTSNSVKDATTDFITSFTDTGTKADLATRTWTTYRINFSRKLIAGETIGFLGFDEILDSGSRSIGTSSCVVEADATAPSATLTVITNTAGTELNSMLVNLSEAHVNDVGTRNTATSASLAATTYYTGITFGANVNGGQRLTTLSALALDTSWTKYMVTVSGTPIALAATTAVSLKKEAVVDQAGLTAAADASATALPDGTAATITLAPAVCNSSADGTEQATLTASPLVLTAKTAGAGGSWAGRKGNALKLRVVNQRGLAIPTIALDSATNVITVTADIGYHTAEDLAVVANNTGFSSSWSVTSNAAGTKLAATLVDATTTAGKDDCYIGVAYNEPAFTLATNRSLTVAGVVTALSGAYSTYSTSLALAELLTFETNQVGAASVVLSASTINQSLVTGARTGSTTLP